MNPQKTHLIRKDYDKDNLGHWAWIAVYVSDEPVVQGENFREEVFALLAADGIRIAPAGSDGAGQPFAFEPYILVTGNTIVVTQSGGLDI